MPIDWRIFHLWKISVSVETACMSGLPCWQGNVWWRWIAVLFAFPTDEQFCKPVATGSCDCRISSIWLHYCSFLPGLLTPVLTGPAPGVRRPVWWSQSTLDIQLRWARKRCTFHGATGWEGYNGKPGREQTVEKQISSHVMLTTMTGWSRWETRRELDGR